MSDPIVEIAITPEMADALEELQILLAFEVPRSRSWLIRYALMSCLQQERQILAEEQAEEESSV